MLSMSSGFIVRAGVLSLLWFRGLMCSGSYTGNIDGDISVDVHPIEYLSSCQGHKEVVELILFIFESKINTDHHSFFST